MSGSSWALHKRMIMLFVVWVGLLVLLLVLAPQERSLRQGIRWVYLHVALIWVGLLGFLVSAGFGLLALWRAPVWLPTWMGPVAWVSLGMFAGGFLISMPTAWVNWGAIFWSEPRYFVVALTICVGLLVQAINGWLSSQRWRGGMLVGFALFVAVALARTPLVLHPRQPIRGDEAGWIPFFFLLFFLLFLGGAGILVWYLRGLLAPSVQPS